MSCLTGFKDDLSSSSNGPLSYKCFSSFFFRPHAGRFSLFSFKFHLWVFFFSSISSRGLCFCTCLFHTSKHTNAQTPSHTRTPQGSQADLLVWEHDGSWRVGIKSKRRNFIQRELKSDLVWQCLMIWPGGAREEGNEGNKSPHWRAFNNERNENRSRVPYEFLYSTHLNGFDKAIMSFAEQGSI